ncbi:MAG TPA: PEP-CTERM sorting domain-containing protein [Lacipirellulaceae bacterium]|jgi:hypothetical protein|nr:PEP-CTERM sorting domain-containing protein [Lacipirellulaceae bacterium]
MWRGAAMLGLMLGACAASPANGQHHHGQGNGSNPLACSPASGEACYYAAIDDFNVHHSPHPEATGEAVFALNVQRTELRYLITLDGLNLKPHAADRTEPDDILGIHLHLYIPGLPGGVGPHVLNIFGLATYGMPAEEDADLVVDYEHHTLTGIYDITDATIDPETGEPYFQFFPLTTKIIDDWLDELDRGELMIAIHTVESGFPTMAIHGHISRVVPEPGTVLMLIFGATWLWVIARRRRFDESGR